MMTSRLLLTFRQPYIALRQQPPHATDVTVYALRPYALSTSTRTDTCVEMAAFQQLSACAHNRAGTISLD